MSTLQDWTDRLVAELAVDEPVDVALVLDLARDAAHGVARPAAPLTAFVVGLAAGRDGLTGPELRGLVERVSALARSWPTEPAGEEPRTGSDRDA